MNKILFASLFFLGGCNALPQLFTSVEQIADDKAIGVEISREAVQKGVDISINVDIANKIGK